MCWRNGLDVGWYGNSVLVERNGILMRKRNGMVESSGMCAELNGRDLDLKKVLSIAVGEMSIAKTVLAIAVGEISIALLMSHLMSLTQYSKLQHCHGRSSL